MRPVECATFRDQLDQIVADATVSAAQQGHLETCADCRAELAWARRIDRVLATWPTPAPPAHFATSVAAAARRETWRHEQVVDWGFNVALAVGLSAIAAGLVGVAWTVGSVAVVDGAPQAALNTVAALLATARAQAPVVATALLLLVTTGGAWWWAEERGRW